MLAAPDIRPRQDKKRIEIPQLQRRFSEDIVHDTSHIVRKESLLQRRYSEDFGADNLSIDTSHRHQLPPDKITCDVITFFLSVSEINLQGHASTTDQILRGALSFFGGKKHNAVATTNTPIPESLIHVDLQSRLRETIPFQTEKTRSRNPDYSLGISIPIVAEEIGVQVLCFSVVLTEEGNGKTVAYTELPLKELVRKYLHGASIINLTMKSLVGPLKKKSATLTLKLARVTPQQHVLFETEDKMMRTYAFYNGEYSTPVIATEDAEAVDSHSVVPALYLSEMVAEMQASLDVWHLRYETKTPREAEPLSSLFFSHDPNMDRIWHDLHPPLDMMYASGFLESHLTTLEKNVTETREMMGLAELLQENNVMFKSSAMKEHRDTQALPTNLCLTSFRLYKSQEITTLQRMRSMSMDLNDTTSLNSHHEDPPPPPPVSIRRGRSVVDEIRQRQDKKKERSVSIDNTLGAAPTPRGSGISSLVVDDTVTIMTCGTPSADALGLEGPNHGLRELEEELVQIAQQLRHVMQLELPEISSNATTGSSSLSSRKSEMSLDDPSVEENRSSSNGSTASAYDDGDSMFTRSARKLNLSALSEATAKRISKVRSDSVDWVKSRVRSDSLDWSLSSREMAAHIDSPGHQQGLWTKWEQTKATYVFRKAICVSQSVSVLVASFLAKLESILDVPIQLEQLARIGFLMGWECLLFSQGKEHRMLSDTYIAVKALEKMQIQLVPLEGSTPRVAFPNATLIHLGIPTDTYNSLPKQLRTSRIQIHCVVFTQGLHEMQNLANFVNASGGQFQGIVNRESFQTLQRYHRAFLDMQNEMNVNMRYRLNMESILEPLMPLVGRNTKYNKALAATNALILLEASDIVRKLHGMRITCCPTGSDHTAMSVTLEQARVLYSKRSANGNASTENFEVVKPIANIMREYGVRIAIAMKNTGRFEYGFNSIQRKLLPDVYRPPTSTIQEITSPFF